MSDIYPVIADQYQFFVRQLVQHKSFDGDEKEQKPSAKASLLNNNRATFAELKRCENLDQILVHPDFVLFQQQLKNKLAQQQVEPKLLEFYFEPLLALIGLAPYLKPNASNTLGAALAASKGSGGDKAIYSEGRFKKLIATTDWQSFYPLLRRAIVMANGDVNPKQLANLCLNWHNQVITKRYNPTEASSKVVFQLANQYFNPTSSKNTSNN